MGAADIDPVVDRLVALVRSVPNVGQVHGHDIYARHDIVPMITTTVDGIEIVRAWWITGPIMRSSVASNAFELERTWEYEVHGITSTTDDDGSPEGPFAPSAIVQMRALALAVTDAIDADRTLGGTAHRVDPCRWSTRPEHRTFLGAIGAAYVKITKPVVTLSLPSAP